MRYTLDGRLITLEAFFADNAECPLPEEETAAILALKPGESVTIGGGAAGTFVLAAHERCSFSPADGHNCTLDDGHALPHVDVYGQRWVDTLTMAVCSCGHVCPNAHALALHQERGRHRGDLPTWKHV